MLPDSSISPPRLPQLARRAARIRGRRLLLWSGCLVFLYLLGGTVFGSAGSGVAYAASTALPYNAGGATETPPLKFYSAASNHSGFVQPHPHVYLVFWGPAWNADTDGVINQVNSTFNALAGSEYNNILAQYTDDAGDYIHNDVSVMASVIDTSTPPSNLDIGFESPFGVIWNAQIRNEADKLIAQNHWAVDLNSQVIVFPQKGSTYNHGGFCGVHAFDSTAASPYAYSEIQYGDQTNCNFTGSPAKDIAWTAVHEYAEAATDPVIQVNAALSGPPWYTALGSGWHTSDSSKSSPQEVADLCEGYDTSNSSASGDYNDPATGMSYTLPYLWSNVDNGCVTAVGQTFKSPAYPGRHTVQNGILSKYQSMGTTTSVLSSPVSEETPLGNGAVSYFSGPCVGSGPNGSCAAIYWSPSTGSQAIWGDDYGEYLYQQGPSGPLGWLTTDPFTRDDGSISYTQHGGLYTGSGTGTHAIWGDSGYKYWTMGENRSPLGWLIGDPFSSNGGTISYTQHGGIYSMSGVGTYAIWGDDGYKYWSMGGPGSALGWLITDPFPSNGGSISYTQHGGIYSMSGVGTYAIWGDDGYKYWTMGGPGSALGWLITDPFSRDGGTISYTQHGGIYSMSGVGTFAEWGNVGYKYWTMGENRSSLGWPIGDPLNSGFGVGVTFAPFQNGAIYDTGAGTFAVWGNIAAKYNLLGSMMGLPVSDPVYLTGGAVSYFQGGNCGNPGPYGSNSAIYDTTPGIPTWDRNNNTHEVHGCIYAAYLSHGGPGGTLGYPISDEHVNSSGYPESDFMHGSIVWANGQALVYYN